jgi:hypothetical protein
MESHEQYFSYTDTALTHETVRREEDQGVSRGGGQNWASPACPPESNACHATRSRSDLSARIRSVACFGVAVAMR